jgi:hypothetical protein
MRFACVSFGAVIVALCGLGARAQEIQVPSGQPLTLYEQLVIAPERRILYLGMLAPLLGGDTPIRFDRASLDLDAICGLLGLPLAHQATIGGDAIDEVVVRLMERPIDYGTTDLEAAQYVNAYDISSGTCEWY